jgi:hypothetical protein
MHERGIDFGDQPRPAPKVKPKKQSNPPIPMSQEVQIKLREAQKQQQILQKKKNPPLQPDYYGRESYEVIRDSRISRGNQLVKTLKTPRDMLIIKEIFDKPLSMRD